MTKSIAAAGVCCALLLPAFASAQQGEEVRHDAPSEDVTSLVISAGGVHQAGNTRTLTVNAGADFQLIRGPHWFESNAAWIFSEDFKTDATVAHNINARSRYDYFFTPLDGLWVLGKVRWDRFAALAPSLQGSAGYARNFVREQRDDGSLSHRFWGEVGYDITGNIYDYDLTGGTGPDSEVLHSARLFVGWQRIMNEHLSLRASVEGLINIPDPSDSRINLDAGANLKVAENFQAGVVFRMLVDTEPQGDARSVDTITQLNLVYTML